MVTIQTVDSRIVRPDGEPADGHIFIQANVPFEYTDPVSGERRKVVTGPVIVAVAEGRIVDQQGQPAGIDLAPTSGAGHDVDNAAYVVTYHFERLPRRTWTEVWRIPADGPAALEITDIEILKTTAMPSMTLPIAGPTGPQGDQGPLGPQGDQGPAGPAPDLSGVALDGGYF